MYEKGEYVLVEHEREVVVGGKYLLAPCAVPGCGKRHNFIVTGVVLSEGIAVANGDGMYTHFEEATRAYMTQPPLHEPGKPWWAARAIAEKRLFRIDTGLVDEANHYTSLPAPKQRKKALDDAIRDLMPFVDPRNGQYDAVL